MSTILYITSNAIHVYAIYIFIDTFLGKSCLSNFFSRLTYILYFLIGTTCWIFTENQTLNLVLNTLPILLITFQYCTSWTRMLFSAISSCAVGMFIDWIAVSAFGYNTIVQTGFIQCVAFLICASLFRYYYKYKDMQPFKSKYLWLLIIISIGTALIGVVTVNENSPYDNDEINPYITEIQASRFYTSSYFMAKAGLNLPYIMLKMAFDEELPVFENKFSPLPDGLVWIKYVDCLPFLTTIEEINKNENELEMWRKYHCS